MDVVNGKIVSAMTERLADGSWSGLKPSRGRVEDGRRESIYGKPDQLPCSSLRGREWAPSWATPPCFSDESPLSAWGGAAAGHGALAGLALEPGAARWNRPSSEKVHSGALHDYSGLQPQPVACHRQGWKRSSSKVPPAGRGVDQRHYHFNSLPCSETKFDEEMTMYESQITRAVSGHFSKALLTSLGQEISTPSAESPVVSLASVDATPGERKSKEYLQRSVSDAGSKQDNKTQSSPKLTLVGTASTDLKRKRSEILENDQADCGWTHPLKILVRKGLSVSDVGELGRIIIPKKHAEAQFPQIDTKEGALLEMEDYTTSKRWFFRFKWWINNKSRMYVLENTGEFIKYHSLKEHDSFVVYEDSSRKMVVRGHKGTDLDSTIAILQGSNVETSSSHKASSTDKSTEDEGPACTPALP